MSDIQKSQGEDLDAQFAGAQEAAEDMREGFMAVLDFLGLDVEL